MTAYVLISIHWISASPFPDVFAIVLVMVKWDKSKAYTIDAFAIPKRTSTAC